MFATRHNQENATHLTAKTPGKTLANAPKTPFRRHDENAAHLPGKTAGKANTLFNTPTMTTTTTTKPRAPLGAKTTNLKTPGPPLQSIRKPGTAAPSSTQKISPRLKRTRIQIHSAGPLPATTTTTSIEDEDALCPDPEYCPPPGLLTPPLPAHPSELDGVDLSVFTREHELRALLSGPETLRGEDGRTPSQRWAESRVETGEAEVTRALDEKEDEERDPVLLDPRLVLVDAEAEQLRVALRKERERGERDRGAARALSRVLVPGFAMGTEASRRRRRGGTGAMDDGPGEEREAGVGTGGAKGNERFVVAKGASRSTLGYSRGRQVSGAKRAPLSSAHRAGVVRKVAGGAREEGRTRGSLDVVRRPGLRQEEEEDDMVDAGLLVMSSDRLIEEEMERLALEDFVLEL